MNAAHDVVQDTARDTVQIKDESPLTPEVAELFALSDAFAAALYPAESNHMVDPSLLAQPHVVFCVARQHGRALGCGASVLYGGSAMPSRPMPKSSACTYTRMHAAWGWARASSNTWSSRRRRGACARCALRRA